MSIELDEPKSSSTRRKPSVTMKLKEQQQKSTTICLLKVKVLATRLSDDQIRDIQHKLKNEAANTKSSSSTIRSSKWPRQLGASSPPPHRYQIGEHVFARGQNNQYYPSQIKEIETMPASRAQLFSVEMFEPRVANKLAIMSIASRQANALGDLLTESDLVSARSIKQGQRVLFLNESKVCEGAFVKIDELQQQQQSSTSSSSGSLANAIFVIDAPADQVLTASQESNSSVSPTTQRFLYVYIRSLFVLNPF